MIITSASFICSLYIASVASYSLLKHLAGPECFFIFSATAVCLTTQPLGAKFPLHCQTTLLRISLEDEDGLTVFDQGYLDYKQFDLYSGKGTRFVTRLKNNACVAVLRELEVDEESVIEEDLMVRLDKDKSRMEHDLRLVITMDTKGKAVMILTNDFNITAEEIGTIYRYRWQIIQLIA